MQLIQGTVTNRTTLDLIYNISRPGFSAIFYHKRNMNIPDAQEDSAGITTEVCHALCFSEIMNCEMPSECDHVPYQGQSISSCSHYP